MPRCTLTGGRAGSAWVPERGRAGPAVRRGCRLRWVFRLAPHRSAAILPRAPARCACSTSPACWPVYRTCRIEGANCADIYALPGMLIHDTCGRLCRGRIGSEENRSVNTPDYVAAVLAKAEAGGAHAAELAALRRRLRQLGEQQAGFLPGKVLEPVADLPRLDELPEPPPGQARKLLDRLVIVKLDGGLGTSMGLAGPKSLLEVKPGASFLAVLATQVLALRERHGARLPLVLMNSAATRGPSLDALRRYDGLRVPGVPLDFLQGREPKIRADDLQPARGRPTRSWSGARPGTAISTPRWRRPARWRPCSAPGCATPSCPTPTTSARSPTSGSPPGSPQSRCRSRWRRCAARWPTARAATSPATKAGWCCGRRRRCPTATPPSPTSSAGAGTTPTTSGSTCARSRTCRPPTRRHQLCH